MRIGIVMPAIMYGCFSSYFSENDRLELEALPNNNNAPAPSIIAKGLIANGHFVRLFTIGNTNRIYISEQVEIVIVKCTGAKFLLFSEFKKAYSLYRAIKKHYLDLNVIHSHWTYHTALSTMPFVNKVETFCTVRDWTPIIKKYLPSFRQRIHIYDSLIKARLGNLFVGISFLKKISRPVAFLIALFPNMLWFSKGIINNVVLNNKKIHFIGNSPYTQELLSSRLAYTVPYIMNPIDDSHLLSGDKVFPDKLRIITIQSMLETRKNVDVLMQAFSNIQRYNSNAELWFMYSKPLQFLKSTSAYKMWEEKGWLNNVRFLCNIPHDDIFQYIDQCSMLVHPALEESFGNIIIEGLMRKTPVIGGEHSGAVPYLLGSGERGYVCDISSSTEIEKCILKVYSNQSESLEKALRGYEWVSRNNTLKPIIEAHIDLYTQYV